MRLASPLLLAAACFAAVCPRAWADEVPPRSPGMQTLVPTEADLARGDIYYLEPGADHQLVMLSDAPLLGLAITTRRMVGYIVCPFEGEDGPPLLGGAFRLPLISLTGGGPDVDQGLRMPGMLDLNHHPEATLRITGVGDVEPLPDAAAPADGPGKPPFRLTLTGDLTLNGKMMQVEWPIELRYSPFVWQQMGRNIGDMVLVRFAQRFRLQDAGINIPPQLAGRLAPEIDLRGYWSFTSVSPDRSLDPTITQADNATLLSFVTRLRDFQDRGAAYARGRELRTLWWDHADRLHRLARAVLDDGGEHRDFAFAQSALDRAFALTPTPDPSMLATRAELLFRLGDAVAALAIAREAAAGADALPPYAAAPIRELVAMLEADVAAASQPAAP